MIFLQVLINLRFVDQIPQVPSVSTRKTRTTVPNKPEEILVVRRGKNKLKLNGSQMNFVLKDHEIYDDLGILRRVSIQLTCLGSYCYS
jgi:hypothetical protein